VIVIFSAVGARDCVHACAQPPREHRRPGRRLGARAGRMGALARRLAAAARARGVEILLSISGREDLRAGGRAVGVRLEEGERSTPRRSSRPRDPKRHVPPLWWNRSTCPSNSPRRRRDQNARAAMKVTCAFVGAAPVVCGYRSPVRILRGRRTSDPRSTMLRRVSRCEVRPTLRASLARGRDAERPRSVCRSPGKHTLSIYVQYSPYHSPRVLGTELKEPYGDCVIETLSE